MKPGCTLRELIEHRKATGLFVGDPESYCRDILNDVANGLTKAWEIHTGAGRRVHAINKPIRGAFFSSSSSISRFSVRIGGRMRVRFKYLHGPIFR